MFLNFKIFCFILTLCLCKLVFGENEANAIARIFSPCKKMSPDFDLCMKRAFNKLRPFFKIGIPEVGVAPFDPHFASEVKQQRGGKTLGYNLTLRNVYERGWTQSFVTKYKTDWDTQRIIYSQYFPEKSLEGNYEFKGNILGISMVRTGHWNLTLRDYSQTTRIKMSGHGLDVRVEIDHIGDMDIHVGNLLSGRGVLESMLDQIINAAWMPGFVVVRPLINDLVSTAFTDIWSKSFKDFPFLEFLPD